MRLKRHLGVMLLARKDTDKAMEDARQSFVKRMIYKMGSQFLIDRNFPLHIYLELSRSCNYKCPMCCRTQMSSLNGHFPVDMADKIIAEAASFGPTSYSLHLFGEPLFNPNWERIIENIRQANKRNAILLTTNGSLMNEANCQRLIDSKVDKIFVSIHSLDPETYRKHTGGGDLSVVMNNIRTFSRLAGTGNKTKLFVRLFHGPDMPQINQQELEALRGLGVFLEVRGYHNYAGVSEEWSSFGNNTKRWACFHPWFTLGVAVDGISTVCCTDFSLGLNIGNAHDRTIHKMWNSEQVESIRKEHMTNKFNRWKACGPCDTWQFHNDIFFDFQYKRLQK